MGFINKSGILEWTKLNIDTTMPTCGVYVLRNSLKQLIYIGMSEVSMKDRLLSHWNNNDIPNVAFFDWYQTSDGQNAKSLEEEWIAKYKPVHNTQLRG
ncbi:MAG: GIY-YIG nuclease family protein [Candidatus Omnitrophica bacterium]|nr:GIY-YIG nuclease family protein [Candidatus Omnitrophota bacterium]